MCGCVCEWVWVSECVPGAPLSLRLSVYRCPTVRVQYQCAVVQWYSGRVSSLARSLAHRGGPCGDGGLACHCGGGPEIPYVYDIRYTIYDMWRHRTVRTGQSIRQLAEVGWVAGYRGYGSGRHSPVKSSTAVSMGSIMSPVMQPAQLADVSDTARYCSPSSRAGRGRAGPG